jgi:hypothetical protein
MSDALRKLHGLNATSRDEQGEMRRRRRALNGGGLRRWQMAMNDFSLRYALEEGVGLEDKFCARRVTRHCKFVIGSRLTLTTGRK